MGSDELRLLIFAFHYEVRDFSLEASGLGDEAFGIFGEKFLVDAGLVIETLKIPGRDEFHQVAVAFFVLG